MKIIAHRGYSARYPENSATSFEQAIALGSDYIETDVRLTNDGVAVCWHDADLARVAGIDLSIAKASLATLKSIALPSGEHIHTLREVLALARGRISVMLDVKLDDDAVRNAITAALDAEAMTDHVVYGARNASHARALVASGARFKRLAMPVRPEDLADYPMTGLIGARLWEDQIDDTALARIRAAGLEIWVTAGIRTSGEASGFITAERLRTLERLGVAAVLVNDVALARTALNDPHH